MPQMAASMKDMFDAEIGKFPVARGEMNRRKWDTLSLENTRVLRRFEFGGVF